jgi:hypothetical protein
MKLRLLVIIAIFITPTYLVAMPVGLSDDCKKAYMQYEAASGRKAFAKGSTQGCGWSLSLNGTLNLAKTRERALNFCKAHQGNNCRVVASQD